MREKQSICTYDIEASLVFIAKTSAAAKWRYDIIQTTKNENLIFTGILYMDQTKDIPKQKESADARWGLRWGWAHILQARITHQCALYWIEHWSGEAHIPAVSTSLILWYYQIPP